MLGRIFVAQQAFSVVIDGQPITVCPGDTVREGHPILAGRDMFFRVQKVKHEFKPAPPARKK